MGAVSVIVNYVLEHHVWVLVISCIAFWYWRQTRYRLPPRPYSWPLVGNFFSVPQDFMFVWCQEVARKFGPVFRVTIGLSDAVIINDMKHAHSALVEKSADFSGRTKSITIELTSEGYQDVALADTDSPLWAKRRKLLATSLRNFSSGRKYEQKTFESVEKLATLFDEKVDKNESFDPKDYCKLFIYNQIAGMCFTKSYDINDQEFRHLIQCFDQVADLFGSVNLNDLLPFLRFLPFETPDRRFIREHTQPIHDLVTREISKHREHRQITDPTDLTHYVLNMLDADDSMTGITDVQIRQTIEDVFAAGVDTTQIQLRWVIACLASYQDQQNKVYDEILQVIGPRSLNDDFEGVSGIDYKHRMPYSEAFLLECTRYGTVTPFGLARRTICDTKIGDYDIPKDTDVLINQYAINFDETGNKDAHRFDPSRFLRDGVLGPRPVSYMPFGAGRRACPGETSSRSTLWMTMVMLVRRYRILPPLDHTGQQVNMDVKYEGSFFNGTPIDYKIRLEYRN